MTTFEYDLDTSGGLMEEIQKLVAPPVSEETLRKQKRGHKEYKRHGKVTNHDYCDSCLEGGDLVCCDRCPVSFHLQCHDPPLEEDDIPPGEWICHRCKHSPKVEKDDDASSTKSGGSNCSGGRGSRYQPPPIPIPVLTGNPLQALAEAARVLNPVQFDLPKDVACTTPLPGSYKRKWWGKDKTQKKPQHELDNGMVPLPAKLCYVCNKSCRVAPLLPCDNCPCLFHLDCLDPPLASVPTGRWMCPNHTENIIDEKLLKSVLLTERVKLWDKFNDRISQHTVKVDFLSKVHRENPPFRIKYRHPRRKAASIPPSVKEFYHRPPDPLPYPTMDCGPLDSDLTTKGQTCTETSLEDQEQWLKSVVSLQTSIAQFLAKKQLERSNSVDSVKTDNSKPEKPTASVQPMQNRDLLDQTSLGTSGLNQFAGNDSKSQNSDTEQIVSNGPLVASPEVLNVNNGPLDVGKGAVSLLNPSACGSLNGDIEMVDVSKSRTDNLLHQDASSNVVKVTWPCGEKQTVTPASNSLPSGNRNIVISAMNKPNNTYTRLVSGAQLGVKQSILSPRGQTVKLGSNLLNRQNSTPQGATTKVITVNAAPPSVSKAAILPAKSQSLASSSGGQTSPAIITLNNTLQQCLEGTSDLELSKLDEKLIQILAWQRLQQLAPTRPAPDTQRSKATLNGLLTSPGLQDVQARAVLCPLSGKGDAVRMPYRTLSVGTGADMDVCLGQFGQCNFISAKHAQIFYDEMSRHYELLNYSEHGTTVDNVLYSCDFSDKPATTPQPSAVVSAVRNLINGKEKPKMKADERLTTTSRHSELKQTCSCKGSSSSLIGGSGAGWEGTALLHHGSYIKVGCIQFVFSIVDHATNQPVHGVKREPMSLLKSTLRAAP